MWITLASAASSTGAADHGPPFATQERLLISPFRPITHLRHVGLAVPNYRDTVAFYTDMWGLQPVVEDDDVTFFGTVADPEQYVLRVRRDTGRRLDLISFGANSSEEVDQLAARLGSAGIALDREPGRLDTPGGGYGVRFFDPDGRLVEVSAGVTQRPFRQLEERESIPKKLSHIVINSTDVSATKAFYEDHLGLLLTDWISDRMCFMRSGTQHHILGIASAPAVSLNHISFEMRGIDEYMRATGRLVRGGQDLLWGPGRHGPGDNTFSYFQDPNDYIVEYTTELETIDDESRWEPRIFDIDKPDTQDQWGISGSMTEMILPAMLKQTDDGLWTPSPI